MGFPAPEQIALGKSVFRLTCPKNPQPAPSILSAVEIGLRTPRRGVPTISSCECICPACTECG